MSEIAERIRKAQARIELARVMAPLDNPAIDLWFNMHIEEARDEVMAAVGENRMEDARTHAALAEAYAALRAHIKSVISGADRAAAEIEKLNGRVTND